MLRRPARLVLIAITVMFAGCTGSPDGILSPLEGRILRLQLEAAEKRWNAQRSLPYRLVEERGCCLGLAPMIVTVSNVSENPGAIIENVTDARYESDGSAVPPSFRSFAMTVPQLFAMIRGALDRPVARLEVTYDREFGYPTMIDIDPDLHVADEEVTVFAHDLQRAGIAAANHD